MGRYPEGFEEWEWRRRGDTPFVQMPQFTQDDVRPGQDVRGKTVLLHSEQGMGDILQFARFARSFRDKGATVVLATYPALVRAVEDDRARHSCRAAGRPVS